MNNLTKKQWATFAVTIVSLILTFLVDSGGAFGMGVKGLTIVGFAKQGWDLYASFSAQNVADFASNATVVEGKGRMRIYSKKDVKEWCKKGNRY